MTGNTPKDGGWTPGPWAAQFQMGEGMHVADSTNIILFRAAGREDPEIEAANAHLIAAAPDLYAALERLITLCGRSGDSLTDFEEIAALFKADTGLMRPGKDAPTPELAATREQYDQWVASVIVDAQVQCARARGEQGEGE